MNLKFECPDCGSPEVFNNNVMQNLNTGEVQPTDNNRDFYCKSCDSLVDLPKVSLTENQQHD